MHRIFLQTELKCKTFALTRKHNNKYKFFDLLFKHSGGGSFLSGYNTLLEPQIKTTLTPEDEGYFVSLNPSKLMYFLEGELINKK